MTTKPATTATIHQSKVGTYHPAPTEHTCMEYGSPEVGGKREDCFVCNSDEWTIHDSRGGYIDGGSACDECGACDCLADESGMRGCDEGDECCGLSFSFVCLDGGDNLCPECAEKAGIEIVECDCK